MQIYEILDAVEAASTREDKMKVLADNDCIALRDIMKTNFDKSIKIYVSKNVEWSPNMEATQSLKDVTKYLVPLSKSDVDRERADASFKAMLEAVHPMDAQILLDSTKKKLKIKGLTEKLVTGVWGEGIVS